MNAVSAATTAKRKKAPPRPLPEAAAPAPTPAATTVPPAPHRTTVLVSRRTPAQKPELQVFAKKVRDAMLDRKMSASDLAREIWGHTTDYRGYTVARNRDRIGHYLAGISYPEPENLKKLADALGLPVEELTIAETGRASDVSGVLARDNRAGMMDPQIIMSNANPEIGTIHLRRLMSMEAIMQIMKIVREDQLPEQEGNEEKPA